MDDPFSLSSVLIRGLNLVIWILVVARVLYQDRPVPRLARQLISITIVAGMATLFVGSLVPYGFPGESARLIYTSFTAFALLLGLGIITGRNE